MLEPSHYPIILIPESLQQAKRSRPELLQFKAIAPSNPVPDATPLSKRTFVTQSAIAVAPGLAIAFHPKSRAAGIGVVVAALIALGMRTLRKAKRNRKSWQANKIYRQELKAYQQKLERYEIKRECAIASFQNKLVLQILGQAIGPDGSKSSARRGWSEADFQDHLERYFSDRIRVGKTLDCSGYPSYPYTPDFVLHDARSGLYIDIEIDEPYAYLNRRPTHFIGYRKDELRNQRILDRGWVVVRFSEEQVVRWPESCCKVVAEAIANLLGQRLPQIFGEIDDLPTMPRWTQEEAITMAGQASRQDYLKST